MRDQSKTNSGLRKEPLLRSVFINYRRNDTEGEAGRLFDELVQRFNPESVFMDVAAIEPGRDFRKAIDESVASCSVLLAMIGQEWLNSKDVHGHRRLEVGSDFVRIELASALRRDIPVIPVLVRGAKMPSAEQLPDDLKELAYRNAIELSHARWRSDVQVLLDALGPYLDVPAAAIAETPAPLTTPVMTEALNSIPAASLDRIGKALAGHIGPVAEIIVKRAAKKSATVADLCALAAFLKTCAP
jgi:hypothetical protein